MYHFRLSNDWAQIEVFKHYVEKENSFHGQYPDTGFFTSFGFPGGYGPHGDTFVYRIFNDNPGGFIKLSFDDWHLSSFCQVRVSIFSLLDLG